MYKILIADDEQIVLDSIKFIVEKNFTDVSVEATARSGREAIEKAESIMPDLVFMDIKMPGINGIDAIREIKSRFSHVQFVILSAYEQFEYAKEAVALGVTEYLLKPVNREKIIETVKKNLEILRLDREKRKRELELKEKLESVLPILENGFIYSSLFFEDNSKELESYKNIFDITEEGGYIMTVEFGEKESSGEIGNKIGLSVKSQSFYPYFRDVLKTKCKAIVGPVMLNRVVSFIPSDLCKEEYIQRLEAVSIAQHIYEKISKKVEAEFFIGIGSTYKGFENLKRSYDESLRAIRYAADKGFVHILDVPLEGVINFEYPYSREKALLDKASSGDSEACLRDFFYIFDWLSNEYSDSIINIKKRLVEIIVIIHRLAFDYSCEGLELINRMNYLEEFQAIDGLTELKIWCKERIELITRCISDMREKKVSTLILKARDFIEKRFDSEITLEEVSKEVNISPHYFSKLFKDETGENFIEYLTQVRIERAKQLLDEGNLSVKEISFGIGYGDPNYFSRIFKKVVGKTPTEYKERI